MKRNNTHIKKGIALILGIVMMLGMLLPVSATEKPAVTAATVSAEAGAKVSVPVELSANPGFNALGIKVSYASEALTLSEISLTDSLISDATVNLAKGKIVFDAVEDIKKDGTLFTLNFNIDSNAKAGNYVVEITLEVLGQGKGIDITDQVSVVNGAVTVTEPAAPEHKFVDVPDNAWYAPYINEAYSLGLVNGKTSERFDPVASINRAEFVTIVYNMAKGTPPEYEPIFKDVPKGAWYTDKILWAAKNKVVKGYEDGRFGVTDNITREQIAVVLYNYANAKGILQDVKPADLSSFKDASSVDGWARDAMAWAVGGGIITGKDNGTALDARGKANRAEATTMVLRFYKKL